MKKILIILLAVLTTSMTLLAQDQYLDKDMNINLGMIQWAERNSEGQITGYKGFNLGMGLSVTKYFDPLEVGKATPFWHWGTVMLLVPYIGVGIHYQVNEAFYLELLTFYLVPTIQIGLTF